MILAVRPLIGIIVGVVITLTVAAVGLVVALRCRANSSNRQSKCKSVTYLIITCIRASSYSVYTSSGILKVVVSGNSCVLLR